MTDEATPTLDPDPDEEPTDRERLARQLERRLDIPMTVLAVVWALFAIELIAKLVVSQHPGRFLRRHWPSVLFLILPLLRVLRLVRALRLVRVLPAGRVVGSSYRAVGTARGLLTGRLQFLLVVTVVVVFGSGQLLFVLERGRDGALTSLGDAFWWSANLAISASIVHEPVTLAGRLLAIVLSAYAIVVFASLAATIGAFFVEARQERAAYEDGNPWAMRLSTRAWSVAARRVRAVDRGVVVRCRGFRRVAGSWGSLPMPMRSPGSG